MGVLDAHCIYDVKDKSLCSKHTRMDQCYNSVISSAVSASDHWCCCHIQTITS